MDQMAIDHKSATDLHYDCNIPLQEGARDGDALRTDALATRPRNLRILARELSPADADAAAPTHTSLSDIMNLLLLEPGTMLWYNQTLQWQRANKAWAAESKIRGAIRWYLHGQRVGATPIFNGICSHCGQLLYGTIGSGMCNKVTGRPKNAEGENVGVASQPLFSLAVGTVLLRRDAAGSLRVGLKNQCVVLDCSFYTRPTVAIVHAPSTERHIGHLAVLHLVPYKVVANAQRQRNFPRAFPRPAQCAEPQGTGR